MAILLPRSVYGDVTATLTGIAQLVDSQQASTFAVLVNDLFSGGAARDWTILSNPATEIATTPSLVLGPAGSGIGQSPIPSPRPPLKYLLTQVSPASGDLIGLTDRATGANADPTGQTTLSAAVTDRMTAVGGAITVSVNNNPSTGYSSAIITVEGGRAVAGGFTGPDASLRGSPIATGAYDSNGRQLLIPFYGFASVLLSSRAVISTFSYKPSATSLLSSIQQLDLFNIKTGANSSTETLKISIRGIKLTDRSNCGSASGSAYAEAYPILNPDNVAGYFSYQDQLPAIGKLGDQLVWLRQHGMSLSESIANRTTAAFGQVARLITQADGSQTTAVEAVFLYPELVAADADNFWPPTLPANCKC